MNARTFQGSPINPTIVFSNCMGLLPDTENCGYRMRREYRNNFFPTTAG